MPYAANDQISRAPIEGGVEITEDQYQQALDDISQGFMVQVADNNMTTVEPPTERSAYWVAPAEKRFTAPGEEPPSDAITVPPPDDYHVIENGQWVYSLDLERDAMVLTRYQTRAALLAADLLDDVEALMADPETPASVRLMWGHKERIRRMHPATLQMAQALQLTDDQVDDLFRSGLQIEP